MRTGFGVVERSRFFRRSEAERERLRARSFRSDERRFSLPSASLSRLRRVRSLDLVRSLPSLAGVALEVSLRLRERLRAERERERDLDARFSRSRRRSPPLDDDDELVLDDDELEELERDPELCDEELLLEELQIKHKLLQSTRFDGRLSRPGWHLVAIQNNK